MKTRHVLPLSFSLCTAQPAKQQARKPKPVVTVYGPKVRKERPNKGHPDWVFLEARRMYETEGKQPKHIQAAIAECGFDISIGTLQNILRYTTRGHLVPEPMRFESYKPSKGLS